MGSRKSRWRGEVTLTCERRVINKLSIFDGTRNKIHVMHKVTKVHGITVNCSK